MNEKRKLTRGRKPLIAAAAVVLIAALTIGGVIAYLQDASDEVKNKFSTNDVSVDVSETTGGKNHDGYNIVPGTSEAKNPKVTGSATLPAYVFVKVDDNTSGLVTYSMADGWTQLTDSAGKNVQGVYYREYDPSADSDSDNNYSYQVLKGDNTNSDGVVTYSSSITKEQIEALGENPDINLTFQAYTIQKEGFDDAYSAYTASHETKVGTADELKAAVAEGGTVTLQKDVTISEPLVVGKGKSVVLNLNGKTINNTTDLWNEKAGNWSLISVQGGTLVITGNGTMNAKQDDCFVADVQDGGALSIENGTFNGNIDAVYVYEGSLTISGGSFDVQQQDRNKGKGFEINSLDANWKNGTNKIVITGGTFKGFDPSNSPSENPTANFVPSGYSVTNSEGIYTVSKTAAESD